MKIQILGQPFQVSFPKEVRNTQGKWVTKGGRGGHAEGTGSDAHTHEPLLEHISNSGMEKQTEALCPEPIMCIQANPGAEDVYWDIPRCFSSQGPAGTWHSALRNSKLWAEHCPCLNSSNQDFTISLREKFFDKPTQDSFFFMLPLV